MFAYILFLFKQQKQPDYETWFFIANPILYTIAHMPNNSKYVGRFAPSPTGPLHFGSMVAALGSFLQARNLDGTWLLRIEDIDPPREVPGASYQILRLLESYKLFWDNEVLYQSTRTDAYLDALSDLSSRNLLYDCGCTRKEICDAGITSRYGSVYAGICREGLKKGKQPRTLRVKTHNTPIEFADKILGPYSQTLEIDFGDFIVRRADNLFAYQLAVVVDDGEQGVTEIVRGSDLLDNTPRQIHLQRLLNIDTPSYAHLPIALNSQGQKLSKQTGARSVEDSRPQEVIISVMSFLGLEPPKELEECSIDDILMWGIRNWDLNKVPVRNIVVPQ